MTPTQATILATLGVIVGALITSLVKLRTAGEANEIDRFEAVLAGLEKRISSLERELDGVKQSLVGEQERHGKTREKLRVALRYIRGIRRERADLPPVPPELAGDL